MSDTVLTEIADGVATITLNRPDRLNAMSPELLEALGDACERTAADEDVRVVVLTGAGRAFCAGGDVKAMAEGGGVGGGGGSVEDRVAELAHRQRRTSLCLHTMPKPTIAAVNGYAMGAGMSVALSCDLRLMAASAQLGTAFAGVALSGDFGGTWFLTRLIGPARARELYLLGDRIPADRALEWGIVNRVVPDEEFVPTVDAVARRLAAGPTRTFAFMKVNLTLAEHTDLETLLDAEALHQIESGRTEDHREAARAFVEKRAPNFVGR